MPLATRRKADRPRSNRRRFPPAFPLASARWRFGGPSSRDPSSRRLPELTIRLRLGEISAEVGYSSIAFIQRAVQNGWWSRRAVRVNQPRFRSGGRLGKRGPPNERRLEATADELQPSFQYPHARPISVGRSDGRRGRNPSGDLSELPMFRRSAAAGARCLSRDGQPRRMREPSRILGRPGAGSR